MQCIYSVLDMILVLISVKLIISASITVFTRVRLLTYGKEFDYGFIRKQNVLCYFNIQCGCRSLNCIMLKQSSVILHATTTTSLWMTYQWEWQWFGHEFLYYQTVYAKCRKNPYLHIQQNRCWTGGVPLST